MANNIILDGAFGRTTGLPRYNTPKIRLSAQHLRLPTNSLPCKWNPEPRYMVGVPVSVYHNIDQFSKVDNGYESRIQRCALQNN